MNTDWGVLFLATHMWCKTKWLTSFEVILVLDQYWMMMILTGWQRGYEDILENPLGVCNRKMVKNLFSRFSLDTILNFIPNQLLTASQISFQMCSCLPPKTFPDLSPTLAVSCSLSTFLSLAAYVASPDSRCKTMIRIYFLNCKRIKGPDLAMEIFPYVVLS